MYFHAALFLFSSLTILVQAQDSVLSANTDVEDYKIATRGEPLTLECINNVSEKPVAWEYPHAVENVKIEHNGKVNTLRVPASKSAVTGLYKCSLKHEDVNTGKEKTFERKFDVVEKPMLKLTYTENSDGGELTCALESTRVDLLYIKTVNEDGSEKVMLKLLGPGKEVEVVVKKQERGTVTYKCDGHNKVTGNASASLQIHRIHKQVPEEAYEVLKCILDAEEPIVKKIRWKFPEMPDYEERENVGMNEVPVTEFLKITKAFLFDCEIQYETKTIIVKYNVTLLPMTSSTVEATTVEATTVKATTVKATTVKATTVKATTVKATTVKATTVEAMEVTPQSTPDDVFSPEMEVSMETMTRTQSDVETGTTDEGTTETIHLSGKENLACLAKALNDKGKYKLALKVYRKLVMDRKKDLGGEHPKTLTALHNMAVTLNKLGKHEEALEVHEDVSDVRNSVLGSKHASTLNSLNSVAYTYQQLGCPTEAQGVLNEILTRHL